MWTYFDKCGPVMWPLLGLSVLGVTVVFWRWWALRQATSGVHTLIQSLRGALVNGDIEAATTQGPVDATTVNGGIRVSMDALTGDGDLDFSTVNGSVRVEMPAALNADLEMSTVNGSLESDYPLTMSGRLNPRHIEATIGSGGRRLRLKTVNGSVELRKR